MKGSVSFDIGRVRVERNLSFSMFQKIYNCLEMTILGGHEEYIFITFVSGFHISSISLEKAYHIDISM